MTTIATDGVTIAADGLRTAGNAIEGYDCKKITVENGVIYALAGDAALRRPVIEWVKTGADPEKAPKGSWGIIVIDRSGPRRYQDTSAYPLEVCYPYTDGTGFEWAAGAMDAGKGPAEAVAIACRRDIYSGGEIQVVNIAEALGLQPALKLVGA